MQENTIGAAPAGVNAKSLYGELTTARTSALAQARKCAELTIPSLLPPDGSTANTVLDSPYQSLGSYGVNNLTAKMVMALYPAGQTFFRHMLPDDIAQANKAQPVEDQAKLDMALAARENTALQFFESGTLRPQKTEEFMHLIVCGNVMVRYDGLDAFRLYRLDQYVVRRDANGKPVEAAIKEVVRASDLDEETRTVCKVQTKDKSVDVYTYVVWKDNRVRWAQQINDIEVPDSGGDEPAETTRWQVLRWKAVPGSDYGRGHCEEYLGDLISYEGLSQSIVEFAAVAAKILLLVESGSTTDVGDLNRARSGDAVAGRKADVSFLQMEKYADFQVVERVAQTLERRLSRAFLLQSGVTRNAERVTAEEFRMTAQELEDTLGGAYTNMAAEEQLPFIRRHLHLLETAGKIKRVAKGTVEPTLVTGFQALGRNHALNKLRGAIQDLVGLLGPNAQSVLKVSVVTNKVLTGWGVEGAQEIIKSEEELAAEQAQARQDMVAQTLMEKGAGPAMGALAKEQMQ